VTQRRRDLDALDFRQQRNDAVKREFPKQPCTGGELFFVAVRGERLEEIASW
jgi:hypothetical protein